jgi:two-component system response regulator AtoC
MSIANSRTILLGEDDLEVCDYLETALICQGYSVEVAHDGEEVLACLRERQAPVSAVVMDVIMPNRDGIDALKEIRRFDRDVPVIMMSGASSHMNVVDAMKSGANDFIAKPLNPGDLRKALKSVLEAKAVPLASPVGPTAPFANTQFFISASPKMRELQNVASSVGASDAPVLVQGETGVGKEVFVRQLHAHSPRAKKAILKLNCAALPSELVESELFGYERGAFTGALQRKLGMFELADGGTILLDEIGDMDFKLQAKLLQVLQDQEFWRIGGKDAIKVNVRVITATHRDLERAITENQFREDLYYRLNVISFRVPPLRERKEDIIAMAEFFIRKHTAPGSSLVTLPPTLQHLFLEYQWPGNVRELENIVRKFLILRDARLVERDLRDNLAWKRINGTLPLERPPAVERQQIEAVVKPANVANGPDATKGYPSGVPEGGIPVLAQVANAKREAERSAIYAALTSTNWNRRQAAIQMRIDYKALLYKMKVLSIQKHNAVAIAGGS